jgi:hypothetical protein
MGLLEEECVGEYFNSGGLFAPYGVYAHFHSIYLYEILNIYSTSFSELSGFAR